MRARSFPTVALLGALLVPAGSGAQDVDTPSPRFEPLDVFELEMASDPQIAPDGTRVVYVRTFFDVMTDRQRSHLWIVSSDGSDHRPLTTGSRNDVSPRWSPDGERLLYVSSEEGSAEIRARWMDTGQTATLAELPESPGGVAWSPDGRQVAFTMFVASPAEPFAALPSPPEGADWGPPIKTIEKLTYRADGAGYLKDGSTHVFVMPAEGGTPRQLTSGAFDHGAPSWTPDGAALIVSANHHEDRAYRPNDTELHEISVADGAFRTLTDREGPDGSPVVSPDGTRIAYLGFDDRLQGYQLTRLYVMDRNGSRPRALTTGLDRSIQSPRWSADGRSLTVLYDDEGNTKLARVDMEGGVEVLAGDVGGLSLGRPYGGGSYSVATDGRFAFTHTRPDHPADVAVGRSQGDVRRITALNDDLFGHKELGETEELWWESSYDGRPVHGWIVKPPGFDPSRRYPLVLEIHGGPFANYGDRFSAEVQLYAAAGYVVLYANPRGSTSYGEEFGNLIHHAYPSQDYDDLMSGVDAVLERGYVDPDNLFVTGGSGGGVLTAWIVGHTDRFRAAVSAKPVINWTSFVLHADNPAFFGPYWFGAHPWEDPEQYLERSPLTYVGNVTTPTMLLTGEQDYRTPIAESEQFYAALKLRRVPSALVRIPDASHGIAAKPSNLMAKVLYILEWFERYRTEEPGVADGA